MCVCVLCITYVVYHRYGASVYSAFLVGAFWVMAAGMCILYIFQVCMLYMCLSGVCIMCFHLCVLLVKCIFKCMGMYVCVYVCM